MTRVFQVNLYAVDGCPLTCVLHKAEIIPYTVYRMRDGVPQIFVRRDNSGVHPDGSVGFIETTAAELK